jgi:hypothetical protein
MSFALPAQAVAAGARNDALLTVLGPSSIRVIGAARVAAGFGTVTSGFRSVAHNRQVGGMPSSYHLVGRALDVARRPGVTHRMIDTALRNAGFVLIESLDERDHSHFAIASALPIATVTPVPQTAEVTVPAPSTPPGPWVAADDHGVLIAASSSLALAAQPLGN